MRVLYIIFVCLLGKLVGVVVLNNESSPESGMLLDVTSTARFSRLLEEESSSTTESEVLLVRRSLAWITGVILLLSTLIGVRKKSYILFNYI